MKTNQEIGWRVEGLFALADQLEERLAKARGQVDHLTPSLPPSHRYGGTGLAPAWTHSFPAPSGCALSLREMDSLVPTHSAPRAFVQHGETNSFHRHPGASSLFTRSQRVQIAGKLIPQFLIGEPASILINRIKQKGYTHEQAR